MLFRSLLPSFAFDEPAERKLITETLRVYEQCVGKKARGWLSSSLRSTEHTPEILAAAGLQYFCDYMNDDQPYLIHTESGPLVNIPYSIEINDFTYFHRRAMTRRDALDMLCGQFDELYRESASTGKMMNVGIHPHISGHPHRMQFYRDLLAHMKKQPDVWWTTREQVADWYLAHHKSHI